MSREQGPGEAGMRPAAISGGRRQSLSVTYDNGAEVD